MKKERIVKGVIAAAVFAAITIVGQFSMKDSPRDLTLSDLASTSDANAECVQWEEPYQYLNTGHCFELTGNCYWDPDGTGCDPYAFQY